MQHRRHQPPIVRPALHAVPPSPFSYPLLVCPIIRLHPSFDPLTMSYVSLHRHSAQLLLCVVLTATASPLCIVSLLWSLLIVLGK